MALKRVTGIGSNLAGRCLNCNAHLGKLRHLRATKCRKCGTVHLVRFTDNGNVVLTDKKYSHLFRREE